MKYLKQPKRHVVPDGFELMKETKSSVVNVMRMKRTLRQYPEEVNDNAEKMLVRLKDRKILQFFVPQDPCLHQIAAAFDGSAVHKDVIDHRSIFIGTKRGRERPGTPMCFLYQLGILFLPLFLCVDPDRCRRHSQNVLFSPAGHGNASFHGGILSLNEYVRKKRLPESQKQKRRRDLFNSDPFSGILPFFRRLSL